MIQYTGLRLVIIGRSFFGKSMDRNVIDGLRSLLFLIVKLSGNYEWE